MPPGAQAAVRPTLRSFPRFSFVVVILHFLVCSSRAQSQDEEGQAFLKFKSSLVNAEGRLSTWNPATPPCSGERGNWVGVLCYNGHVWGLQLENMNLKGLIDVDALSRCASCARSASWATPSRGPCPTGRRSAPSRPSTLPTTNSPARWRRMPLSIIFISAT